MIFSFIGCMLCLCIMAASVGGVLLSMYIVQVTADDAETLDLDNQKNRQTSIVYDINGNEYASLSRNENRIWRELSAMPENLQNAVIAIEDKNFRTEARHQPQGHHRRGAERFHRQPHLGHEPRCVHAGAAAHQEPDRR